MNLFKKIMLSVLSLTALSTFEIDAQHCNHRHQREEPAYRRIISTIHQRPDSGTAPVFLDPNHVRMIGTGLYTQQDADAITAEAIAQFYASYGIDFGSVAPNAQGIRTIAGVGSMIPYIDGLEKDIILVTDSKHPKRAESGRWFSLQVGQAVAFSGSGVFPGGINAGASYDVGDNWVTVYYNLLKSDSDWRRSRNREEFRVYTYEIGKVVPSEWNRTQILLSLSITDKYDHEGFGVSGTVDVRRPAGTGPFFITVADTFFFDWNDS